LGLKRIFLTLLLLLNEGLPPAATDAGR